MRKKYFIIIASFFILACFYLILNYSVTNKDNLGKWVSTKGGETGDIHQWSSYQKIIHELNLAWARIPINWSEVEISDGVYDWSASGYINFKNAVISAKEMGAEVIITVRDAPGFLIDGVYGFGPEGTATPWPDLCGRITTQGNIHLANFIKLLIERLKLDFSLSSNAPPPVTYIELWNEPDVDPSQTLRPDLYGCWQRGVSNIAGTPAEAETSPSYDAGSYYAQVLNSVAPSVKKEIPSIKFVAGAAASANSGFLSSIIDHALNNIDVVSYHQYVKTTNTTCDIPFLISVQEQSFHFVRNYLDSHGGISKPILISEGALRYAAAKLTVTPSETQTPAPSFYDCQARFASTLLAWTQDKAETEKLLGFIWYTVGVNGWEETDLLYPNKTPKPVYFSWKN
jgi:hypothetical protein